MLWVILIACGIAFVEIFSAFEVIDDLKKTGLRIRGIFKVINSASMSDEEKETALLGHSKKMAYQSFRLLIVIIISFSPLLIAILFTNYFTQPLLYLLLSTKGAFVLTVTVAFYAMVRSKISDSSYGLGSKLLHKVALGTSSIPMASFDMEKMVHLKETEDVSQERHVFVAGLARSGSTILMRRLYETGEFHSLTYRDMPFVLAPNLWGKLVQFSSRQRRQKERAHGDGIMVDFDSPEALEEVFWRVFSGADYIKKNRLRIMNPDQETISEFRSYVSLILKGRHVKRYLSKNNNNILRLRGISQAFPRAVMLIPFREPLQQSFSLLKQHKRFLEDHKRNPFSRKYMGWLVHHEFGADHRPFIFKQEPDFQYDPDNLNYWLQLWDYVYRNIMDNKPSNAYLISYDKLCEDTSEVWGALCSMLNIQLAIDPLAFTKSFKEIDAAQFSQDVFNKASETHRKLLSQI